jgi:hypothetical protein
VDIAQYTIPGGSFLWYFFQAEATSLLSADDSFDLLDSPVIVKASLQVRKSPIRSLLRQILKIAGETIILFST